MTETWEDHEHISTYHAGLVYLSIEEVEGGWKASVEGTRRYTSNVVFETREEAKKAAAVIALMKLGECETAIATQDLMAAKGNRS